MKRILVICPLMRDRRELAFIDHPHTIIFQPPFDNTDIAHIDYLDQLIKQNNIDAVMSTTDDIGTLLNAIIAQQYSMLAPDPQVIAHQQHKYYARLTHQKLVPEATPKFALLHTSTSHSLSFPMFIKPVRANFSCAAQAVYTSDELNYAYKNAYDHCQSHPWFDLAQSYLPSSSKAVVLAEQLCVGLQCTAEGFMYDNIITFIGITDSIMFPGTISFKRFDYPSALPTTVQQRIYIIAAKLMEGIGFNNGFFNIECIYNPDADTIHILEVNPRMASQFADLYEKVEGFNSYQILLSIITHQKPHIEFKQGSFACASSCILRVFKDQRIVAMPSANRLATIYKTYPEARIELCGTPGQKLSELPQDGRSFRYALIHVGGQNLSDIEEKAAHIEQMLRIKLVDL